MAGDDEDFLQCETCGHKTRPGTLEQMLQLLLIHERSRHPVPAPVPVQAQPQQHAGGAVAKTQKIERPVIKTGIGEDDFQFFESEWKCYKRACKLTDAAEIRDQLRCCCDADLKRDLYRSLGSSIDSSTEAQMLKEIKNLAVISRSNPVNMVKLLNLMQEREEPVRAYLARIKGAASVCTLTVDCTKEGCDEKVSYADKIIQHTLVKGLADQETQKEVLGATKEKNLDDTVLFVEARESSKRSVDELSSGSLASGQVGKLSVYQHTKKKELVEKGDTEDRSKCKYCNKVGHGSAPNISVRKNACPAWDKSCKKCEKIGHFSNVCRENVEKVKAEAVKTKHTDEDDPTPMLHSVKLSSLSDLEGNVCQIKITEPIPHLVEHDGKFVVAKPANQPKLMVEMQVDVAAYEEHGLICKLGKQWTKKNGKLLAPPKDFLTTDTGAQVDCVNKARLKKLGLTEKHLLKTQLNLDCANETSAGVLGAFFALVSSKSLSGKKKTVRVLVYVIKVGGNLMSETTLKKLGVLPDSFPTCGEYEQDAKDTIAQLLAVSTGMGELLQPVGECDHESEIPCQCPRREFVDPPNSMPYQATLEKLEDWLKDYYASSAFNICKRQTMPSTAGPPMRIHTRSDVVPCVVHKPSPVPLHWRAQVRAGLDADVRRGVLGKVPPDTPVTWCTRMVLQPKKNGNVRRTIDLHALSKAGIRETHHTRSPFIRVACSVPSQTYKSTLDCVDGYHGVPLAEEDQHKTTFITDWGRFYYKRTPHGYGSSNDGYTHRTDDILDGCPGKPEQQDFEKIVDDIIQWSNDIETSFFRISNVLSHCNKNGMIFSPEKFNFAKTEVEYVGLVLGTSSIKPTEKYLSSIIDFPTPTNVTDIRSWFGLINQVAYCFSKSSVMLPFRELLSPSSTFLWTQELEKAFQASKDEIVRLVEYGVKMYNPQLPTCLSPDFCQTGLGWVLQQKTCRCVAMTPVCCPGGWRLVLAGGRFTKKAETKYHPTEGEALAVVYGLESSKYYTLGCQNLFVATDHKPLLGIFNDRALDTIENPRIQKFKERTLGWSSW
jgi:hypothetical protein